MIVVKDATRGPGCTDQVFVREGPWRASAPATTLSQWLVKDGPWEAWLELERAEWFDDAERIVRAFMRQTVIDRREKRGRIPPDPLLPLAAASEQITSVWRSGDGSSGS